MTGYEFMGLHPFLTAFLALMLAMTITETVKHLSSIGRKKDEQTDQEKES